LRGNDRQQTLFVQGLIGEIMRLWKKRYKFLLSVKNVYGDLLFAVVYVKAWNYDKAKLAATVLAEDSCRLGNYQFVSLNQYQKAKP
jgi:hypothetical protein